MKSEQAIRDFSLRLIGILVWFEILWAIVFLFGMVFQWTGLTQQLEMAFFGSGFCGIVLLAALAIFNVTANLNIISKAQVCLATGEPAMKSKGFFARTISIAAVLIGMVVLSLWFAERRLYQGKEAEAVAKIESIAGTKLAEEAIDLICADEKVMELAKVLEALAGDIQSGGRLSILFPMKVKDAELYYELTAWYHGSGEKYKKISEADFTKFVPSAKEQRKFEQLRRGEITAFTVPHRDELRTFRSVVTDKGKIILLLDTSRRSEYSRGSFD